MHKSNIIKFISSLYLAVHALFITYSGCAPLPDEFNSIIEKSGLIVNVVIPDSPVTGTLYCNVYKHNDFSADPDWSSSVKLTGASGIQVVYVNVPYDDVIDNKIYLSVMFDENSNHVADGNELLEYYGNLALADLSNGRISTYIDYAGSEMADIILDKRYNDPATPAPLGLEVNAYYADGVVGNNLYCLVFKGSQGNTYKDKDWLAGPVQITETLGIAQFLITDEMTGETEITFLVECVPTAQYGPPWPDLYFEYYNNKNVTDAQGKKCNLVPVDSSMDMILGNILGG